MRFRSPMHWNSPVRLCRLVAIAVSLAATLPAAADEWPSIRGIHHDGHSAETGLADSWPAEGPPVLWTRELGQGYSAFVAAKGRVFTQAQSMAGQFVYCLDARTGQTIWRHRYDWAYESAGVYPGPRSTPTLLDDRVYFATPDGMLGCLRQRDGRELWTADLNERYGIEGVGFGYACSPIVADGRVFMPVGSAGAGMVALNAASGEEIWSAGNDPASYTPAFPVELDQQPLVVGYLQNALIIHHQETGAERHRIHLSTGYDEHSAWPVYREPFLWISGPFRAGSRLLDLSEQPARTVWQSRLLSNDVCSSVCVNGYLYGFDIVDVQSKTHRPSRGVFRCLEFHSGKPCWEVGSTNPWRSLTDAEKRTRIGQGSLIAADDKLIVLNELGELILLAVDHRRCRELARCSVLAGELTWTAPCLSDQRIYVRNQSRAVCVYVGQADAISNSRGLLHTADLDQQQWFDLAGFLLAVEPEYAFDVPSDRWLWQWLIACTGILLSGYAVSWLLQRSHFDGRFSTVAMVTAVLLGAAGTTVLGHITGEFIFTWPVCLYAAFAWVNDSAFPSTGRSWTATLQRRVPVVVLLGICGAYFLICRRLSLVFEWAFLTGFVGAFPLAAFLRIFERLTTKASPNGGWAPLLRMTAGVFGLWLFFAASAAFLKWRY